MTISASRTDKAFHLLDYSLIIARNETKEGLAHTFSSVETLEISQWFNTYPKCQSVLRLLLEVTSFTGDGYHATQTIDISSVLWYCISTI